MRLLVLTLVTACTVDTDLSCATLHPDSDLDGYGDPSVAIESCAPVPDTPREAWVDAFSVSCF